MNWFKDCENYERKRIFEALRKAKPGSVEYRDLQNLLVEYEVIDEKRRQGKITQADILKWTATAAVTLVALHADTLIPVIGTKLKIAEFGLRLFK